MNNRLKFKDLMPGNLLSINRKSGFSFRLSTDPNPEWFAANYEKHVLFLRREKFVADTIPCFYSFVLNDFVVYSRLSNEEFIDNLFTLEA